MVKPVFGGFAISDSASFNTPEIREQLLSVLLSNGVTNIDTARAYPGSETAIGALDKRNSFAIDTKLLGGFASGSTTKDAVIRDSQDSLTKANIKQFDILYLHAPDTTVPFEETLEGINEVFKKGIFKRFGVSNFSAEQVEQVYNIAKAKGYPLPQVYQGNYNPVARHLETKLLPTLRKLGIAFYAYSPLAGGFLTKTSADLDYGAGRFNSQALNGLYKSMYDKPSLRAALTMWEEAAKKEGVPKAELAYRWIAYHSCLQDEEDGVVFGASSLDQAVQTAQALKKGKLSADVVKLIEEIWESVKADAPLDNYTGSQGL